MKRMFALAAVVAVCCAGCAVPVDYARRKAALTRPQAVACVDDFMVKVYGSWRPKLTKGADDDSCYFYLSGPTVNYGHYTETKGALTRLAYSDIASVKVERQSVPVAMTVLPLFAGAGCCLIDPTGSFMNQVTVTTQDGKTQVFNLIDYSFHDFRGYIPFWVCDPLWQNRKAAAAGAALDYLKDHPNR